MAASTGNSTRVDELAELFVRDVKKLLEVSKVARNLSASEPIAITAEKVEENIQTLCPHVSKIFTHSQSLRVSTNYSYMVVLIGGGNLTKGETKNF